MKLLIVFVLAITLVHAEANCRTSVIALNDPHCGELPTCYFNGKNKQAVENESCRRGENGQTGFFFIKKGKCPTDKPACSHIL
ncbi:accessory gland protein Acp63F [Drosophila biarmipes]|uniref:accessory gland protein Acp63F n=1 Tax=Drosophila biarmipes TaxID=125945 RepID=UPI0007E7A800|nr:accessory gland protein Acp63F [Drosophila biarmipes]